MALLLLHVLSVKWGIFLVKSVWLKQSIFSIYFLYLILQNQNISCLFQWYDVITLISAVKALWGLWIYWLETSLFPNKTIETGFTMHHNLAVSFYKIPLYAYDGKTLHTPGKPVDNLQILLIWNCQFLFWTMPLMHLKADLRIIFYTGYFLLSEPVTFHRRHQ